MYAIRKNERFIPVRGDPIFYDRAGKEKMRASKIIRDGRQEDFGVFEVVPFELPIGKTTCGFPDYVLGEDGRVSQVYTVVDNCLCDEDLHVNVCSLEGEHVRRGQILVSGLGYPVVFTGVTIKIGCEEHSPEAWALFTDTDIAAMDGLPGAKFWKANKDVILAMADYLLSAGVVKKEGGTSRP